MCIVSWLVLLVWTTRGLQVRQVRGRGLVVTSAGTHSGLKVRGVCVA